MFDFTGQSGELKVFKCVACQHYVAVPVREKVFHPQLNGFVCPPCSSTLRKGEKA